MNGPPQEAQTTSRGITTALTGSSQVLLFVREQQRDELGTSPSLFLGRGDYVSHLGSRPISIAWRLEHAMPSEEFDAASVAAV